MSTWIESKTDWSTDDYFNAEDYNRIVGNLMYLKMFARKLFGKNVPFEIPLSKGTSDMFYADEMNGIENLVEAINSSSYAFNFGEKTIYTDNGNVPIADEYNRLESAILKLYETMQVHEESLPKLAITLGNEKGIRV